MIHQLEIGGHDYGRRGITVCPEWHNSAVFIAWIEENISPRPQQRYPSGYRCLHARPVDNDKNEPISGLRFPRSENST